MTFIILAASERGWIKIWRLFGTPILGDDTFLERRLITPFPIERNLYLYSMSPE